MSELKRIGIIGCGTMGTELARAISTQFKDRARLMVLCDRDERKAIKLSNELDPHPDVLPLEAISLHCDLLIEAASPEVCKSIVPKALEMGRDIMVMSVAGLFDIYEETFTLARSKNANLYIPSGGIAGIDGLEAAMVGGVTSVKLTIHKSPEALADSPYVVEKGLRLAELLDEATIFEGNTREAVKAFPFNVNVAATLSFAGLGPDQTQVRVITGKNVINNIYEVEVEGAFGKMFTRTESLAFPDNPSTSFLSVLSACATLNEILNPVKIGT